MHWNKSELTFFCNFFRLNSVNANPVEWSNEVSNLISTITHRRDKFPEDFEFGAATAAFQVNINIFFVNSFKPDNYYRNGLNNI